MTGRYERALDNVKAVFDSPTAIGTASDLTTAQKIKLLKEWDYDLRLRMVASEENMPAADTAADTKVAERLMEVGEWLVRLGGHPASAGTTKTG